MMRFKSRRRTSLLTILLLWTTLFPAAAARAQDTASAAAAAPSAAATPKFLSWNAAGGVCGDKRSHSEFTPVVTELQYLQVVHSFDVLGLQEVHYDQAVRLARALYPYGIRRTPFFVPTVKCRDGSLKGIAILSRYRLGGRRVYSLHNSKRDLDNDEHRKLMGASIRFNGRLIRVYNTHLTADGFSDRRNRVREEQARDIRGHMYNDRDDASGPWRAVLTGDFNTEPRTRAYNILTRRMRDAWAVSAGRLEGDEGCTHYPSRGPCTRVDYIFYEGAIGLGSAGVLDTGRLSDHLPVVAHFILD